MLKSVGWLTNWWNNKNGHCAACCRISSRLLLLPCELVLAPKARPRHRIVIRVSHSYGVLPERGGGRKPSNPCQYGKLMPAVLRTLNWWWWWRCDDDDEANWAKIFTLLLIVWVLCRLTTEHSVVVYSWKSDCVECCRDHSSLYSKPLTLMVRR